MELCPDYVTLPLSSSVMGPGVGVCMVHHGVHHGGDHTDAGHLRAVGVWILISYLLFYSVLVMHSVATVLVPDYQTGAGRRRIGLESLYR